LRRKSKRETLVSARQRMPQFPLHPYSLREKRGISQRAAAKLIGASQPYVAKLESGRIKNLGIKTLVKYATALGGKLTLKIDAANSGSKPSHRVLRKAS
jgi:transcriptional regulator with XRE-family HTH domain